MAAENNTYRASPCGAAGKRSKSRLSDKKGKHILTRKSRDDKKIECQDILPPFIQRSQAFKRRSNLTDTA